mmetsp:Transcript_381/g.818  ORF Transcript_381/g.818 Transcript_381/m.818 type:complete len:224 (-) Transcript_381:975-1646(-)
MTLLDHVRKLVEVERGLSDALEKTQPLLSNQASANTSVVMAPTLNAAPLLPTPRNEEEVQTILAVARAYSLRTSAPPMWSPQLPVIGFATPNPLPHQLRGGQLGALQMQMAREERNRMQMAQERERERLARVEEEKKKGGDAMDIEYAGLSDRKRKRDKEASDVKESASKQVTVVKASVDKPRVQTHRQRLSTEEYQKRKDAANMNLSDSSSSEDEESSSGET